MFERIAIVGVGLIGGSLAAAFKREKLSAEVIGVDYESVVQSAKTVGLISQSYEVSQLGEAIHNADLVILATPISSIVELIPSIGQRVRPGTLVTDVGSTKETIVATAQKHLPEGVYFLGGHPMTGSDKSGLRHADPSLFEGSVYAIVDDPSVPRGALQDFLSLVERIGAQTMFFSASAHDQLVAAVSHLPQIVATTLAKYVFERNEQDSRSLSLAAGGFKDMTRIAASPFQMWRDIFQTNRENITKAIDD